VKCDADEERGEDLHGEGAQAECVNGAVTDWVKKLRVVGTPIGGASVGQRGKVSVLREDPAAPPGSLLMTKEVLIGQLLSSKRLSLPLVQTPQGG